MPCNDKRFECRLDQPPCLLLQLCGHHREDLQSRLNHNDGMNTASRLEYGLISYHNLLLCLRSMSSSCCFLTIFSLLLGVSQYGLLHLEQTFGGLSFVSSFGSQLCPHLSHKYPFSVICGIYILSIYSGVFMIYYITRDKANTS